MKVSFSSNIYNTQYKTNSRQQKRVSFQAVPKKILPRDIIKGAEEGSYNLINFIQKDVKGEVAPIDWNIKNSYGDNILMMLIKSKADSADIILNEFVDFANETDKIDVNYSSYRYSLPQCALYYNPERISKLFKLKNIEIDKLQDTGFGEKMNIIEMAITKRLNRDTFENLVCHPSMDISKYNIMELCDFLAKAYRSDTLSEYYYSSYMRAIQRGLKVRNSRMTQKYYEKNGILTLSQIYDHINNCDCERAINAPLNCIGETIGHFLAETDINPDDEDSIKILNKTIDKLRANGYYFWQEDDIGRTAPMLALECWNFVTAKAMMEKMRKQEFMYIPMGQRRGSYINDIENPDINHESAYRDVIAKIDPQKRLEFHNLLTKRLINED